MPRRLRSLGGLNRRKRSNVYHSALHAGSTFGFATHPVILGFAAGRMKKLNRETLPLGKIYNTVRPHQALGYLTPLQFLRQNPSQRKE